MGALTFLGAAGTVTGSKFLVHGMVGSVLVDCGLFQGLRELRRRNWEPIDLDVVGLDAVVISHAHLDHVGYLPALVRQGFDGRVLLTAATAELAEIVLRDSAKLMEEEASYAAAHLYSKHRHPKPLYGAADVERVLPLFETIAFGQPVDVGPDIVVTLQPAGHILGSASAHLAVDAVGVTFSGDLGRGEHPLLVPPAPPAASSAIVVESTYGNRWHEDDPATAFAAAITRTIDRGGSVVVPSFAVDRTEVILMVLKQLITSGAVPQVPVYVDSPMALRGLSVYRAAIASADADIRPELAGTGDVFDPGDLREARTAEESARLNQPSEPCIIISASGMATGGRILHHLKAMLPDPRHSVILVGFQAVGTRGRDLADGATQVKMHGAYVPVRAEIVDLPGFSVHADADELVAWLASAPEPPQVVYVVHGEPDASHALADRIRSQLGWLAVVPRDGERVRLG